ncbi:MAG: GntR family transcriptional regulator, partial [Alcaligenaceae bacterium]|nr:GntR family transcriptional regulator [Alcaligenaceae bacterium]
MSASASPVSKGAAIGSAAFSPLYKQIKALLVQSLHGGEWKPGESIPSELDLAARFQVSQGTVRKAIDELASENLLIRRQGKGTFVATHHEAQVRYRFLRLTPDDPENTQRAQSTILECSRQKATPEQARLLEVHNGESLI